MRASSCACAGRRDGLTVQSCVASALLACRVEVSRAREACHGVAKTSSHDATCTHSSPILHGSTRSPSSCSGGPVSAAVPVTIETWEAAPSKAVTPGRNGIQHALLPPPPSSHLSSPPKAAPARGATTAQPLQLPAHSQDHLRRPLRRRSRWHRHHWHRRRCAGSAPGCCQHGRRVQVPGISPCGKAAAAGCFSSTTEGAWALCFSASHMPSWLTCRRDTRGAVQMWIVSEVLRILQSHTCMKARNGARPVPGPTMMMGVEGSSGRRKSGFLDTYTGSVSPTWTRKKSTCSDNAAMTVDGLHRMLG